jgi:N-hydroxyarylamine O-acetyltransferase
MSLFDTAGFDLDAYLARIGYEGRRSPDLETLRAITYHHPLAIPFENLNPLAGRPVPLDNAALLRKLVQERRGGWCFEHNLLLGTALTAIGFDVTGLGARVLWNVPPGVVRPRSHMVLLLRIDGEPYIADAGFGGLTMTAPLRLARDVAQQTPHEPFRLTGSGDDYIAEAHIRGEWRALYRFGLHPQARVDYEVVSWYLAHHPQSHFTFTLVAARAQPDCRYALSNADFAVHHRDGYTERRMLMSAAEARRLLQDVFGIDVPQGDDIDAALARVVGAAAAT